MRAGAYRPQEHCHYSPMVQGGTAAGQVQVRAWVVQVVADFSPVRRAGVSEIVRFKTCAMAG